MNLNPVLEGDNYADYDIKNCIDLVNEIWTNIISVNIFNSWNKILNRKPGIAEKNLTHSATRLLETAPCNATCKAISDEVTEWINECGEAERITEETDTTEESFHSQLSARQKKLRDCYIIYKKLFQQNQKFQIVQNL
ncbi:hypothetical protein K0M31_012817 [Melipona bicolor]|uniref:Uncharacterized protein n=1 Tax=Melipona bicolor TaxID=60889 RepID=A0AA40FJ88_9HYME|nr:hypothetical protein K0M31_012817 [Melipona bicolor]